MADDTLIEWTRHPVTGKGATWNPITGCTLVSDGCRHCYAARLAATRLKHHPSRKGLARLNAAGEAKFTGEVRFNEEWLTQPLRWKRPRMIFVCAYGDLFHESVPDEWIDRVFAVMALSYQHTFQVLTKRSKRMRKYLIDRGSEAAIFDRSAGGGESRMGTKDRILLEAAILARQSGIEMAQGGFRWPLPNVWLGVSAEDQSTADERIPDLLATPAAIRFVSAEPLLGPIDFTCLSADGDSEMDALNPTPWAEEIDRWRGTEAEWEESFLDWYGLLAMPTGNMHPTIDQIIVGGESGEKARPMHPDWARAIRDQCKEAGTAFFFKQWGSWLPWEPEHGPCWVSQNGRSEDRHILFPADFDNTPGWDDGLWAVSNGEGHAAFQRVRKKAAGRLLDGVEHSEMPSRPKAQQ